MAVKILSKQSRVGILKQAAWTTPQAASANFRTLYYNAGSVNPEPDVQKDEYNVTSQNGLLSEDERGFVDSVSGLPSISFSGVADRNTLAAHLVAAFQAVTEGATTPFEKTITSGAIAGPVDFAADAGFLHTIALDINASADDGIILENAVLDSLNIVWDFNSRGIGKLAQISGVWKGNEMNVEQTLSGTWVTTTITPYNNTDTFTLDTFTIDSVDYATQCVRRYELSINNNVTSNCKTTGGKANQYDITPDYRSTIILDYNATTEKILGDYKTDALVVATFKNELDPQVETGYLSIAGTRGRLQKNPYMYNGEFVGLALDVKWKSYAAATPLTIVMNDAVDWTY